MSADSIVYRTVLHHTKYKKEENLKERPKNCNLRPQIRILLFHRKSTNKKLNVQYYGQKKTKNLTTIKHSLRNFPSKRTLMTTIRHQLSTTHETLHYLSNSTTKLRGINFKKIPSPKSNHHNYTKKNHAPSTLNSTPYQSSYRSRGIENSENLMDSYPIIPKIKVPLSHFNMIMVQVYIFSALSREI